MSKTATRLQYMQMIDGKLLPKSATKQELIDMVSRDHPTKTQCRASYVRATYRILVDPRNKTRMDRWLNE